MRLPLPAVASLVPAPSRGVQFVVEIVGPRTVPAAQAAGLLRPDWRAALGEPELWTMRPADTAWQAMDARTDGSYDSIALAWDLVAPQGEMSAASAGHLAGVAERFANDVGRRAIPLTAPNDVPQAVRRLKSAQDGLDAGVSILLVGPHPWAAAEYGSVLDGLGLGRDAEGWAWRAADHPEPLFQAIPFEDGPATDGFTLGFRLARCPDPAVGVEGMLQVADALRDRLAPYDEDRRPLTPKGRDSLRDAVRAGSRALDSIGLRPGTWAALKAFS